MAGCLAQRYGEQLQSLIPEVDGVIGTGAYAGIVELLDDVEAGRRPVRLGIQAEPEHDFLPRLITTPRATAYLKIAEGCDHPCTFCIIPTLRGRFRSRSMESVCAEARALVAGGAKELILIAQDTSMWGRDRGVRRGVNDSLIRADHFRKPGATQSFQPLGKGAEPIQYADEPDSRINAISTNCDAATARGFKSETASLEIRATG